MGIKTKKNLTGRLTNMIIKLQKYNYKLKYILGKTNHVANALLQLLIAKKTVRTMAIIGRPKEHKEKDYEDESYTKGRKGNI